jgi:hypothetical protein
MKAMAQASRGMPLPKPDFFLDPPPNVPPVQPQEEKASPHLQGGVGSAYPVNQAMARGEVERPVTLKEANQMPIKQKPALSPESLQAIQMTQVDVPEEPKDEPVPKQEFKSVAEETQQELDQASDQFEPDTPLDVSALMEARMSIMSPQRREVIEGRLKPLDIGDMITKREIVQEVPIIPGKLTAMFRTFSQRENIWVLQYLYDFPGSNAYVQELLNTCQLVCGLVSINGQYLPDHRTNVGTPSEAVDRDAFKKKMFHVTSFPIQLVADISVQMLWFQDRVSKLLTIDELKNG